MNFIKPLCFTTLLVTTLLVCCIQYNSAVGPIQWGQQITNNNYKFICRGWKCPEFTVVKDFTEVEGAEEFVQERRYDSYQTVATTVSGCGNFSDYLLEGYLPLFRYRTGNNVANFRFPMTVPVIVEVKNLTYRNSLGYIRATCDADFTVRFYLSPINRPGGYPKPNQENVTLEVVPSADVYVTTSGGYLEDVVQKWNQMKKDLTKLGLCFQEETYTVALYDPPWKKHGRRNEIWIQTKQCASSSPQTNET